MKMNDFDLSEYENRYPAVNPNALFDGASIDREVAEKTLCQEYGGKCEYKPFVDQNDYRTQSYCAFAVCTICGEAYEF